MSHLFTFHEVSLESVGLDHMKLIVRTDQLIVFIRNLVSHRGQPEVPTNRKQNNNQFKSNIYE